jgi:hypothetical protein
MTTYKVRIPLHGSPSEEQLTALTDAIGRDGRASNVEAVVSGSTDNDARPTRAVTFTVEAAGSWLGEESGDVTRQVHAIVYGTADDGFSGVAHAREFLSPDPDQPAVPDEHGNIPRAWFKSWRVISFSVHVKAHGSPSEEQLEAIMDALGGDAGTVVSAGTGDPVWSVTLTVEASDPGSAVITGSNRVREAARKAKIFQLAMGIFHGEATAHDMLGPHPDQMRLQPDEGPTVS